MNLVLSVPELPEQPELQSARRSLQIQVDGIKGLINRLDESFSHAVRMILRCEGRVVLTGMGKSGLICQKIAATFASTGTSAQFLHPAEAIHGDLGIIAPKDLVIAVSYSGETEEVVRLLPTIKRFAVPLISLTGYMNSTIAKAGDIHIDIAVPKEACPLGLAPTASTTATLAMGDALAVALLEARGFTAEEFATFHPGGSLGKRLLLRVEDVMHCDKHMPLVRTHVTVKEALFEITGKRMGITGVIDDERDLVGVFADGDLRRLITKNVDAIETPIIDVMSPVGQRIDRRELAVSALRRMEDQEITSLFVVESEADPDLPVGIIHLHDLLKAGIA